MKVTVAVDSLKGSLTSMEAGKAVMEGVRLVVPDAEVAVRPLADGGEGTVEALAAGMGGTIHTLTVTGPIGLPVKCDYCILEERRTAIIEMAGAAGITLVPDEKKNPLYTTSYGVGEVIKDAVLKGCRKFIVGIGGSATNDGGIGMLQALGYSFYDSCRRPAAFGAVGLRDLAAIEVGEVLPELRDCTFYIACDVANPLCGENGCSAVYGPQKGATPEMVAQMDRWMDGYARLAKKKFPKADPLYPGAGAAGGLGFAFLAFTKAVLEQGVSIVLRETNLEQYIEEADIVITGEGRLDSQTAMGKAPIGVAKLAKKYGKTVIAFAGGVTEGARECNAHGIDAFFPIVRGVTTLCEAMAPETARKNMKYAAEQAMRLFQKARDQA